MRGAAWKSLLAALLALLLAVNPAAATWAFINASTCVPSGSTGCTTTSASFSGSDLLVIIEGVASGSVTTPTDSSSNSWTLAPHQGIEVDQTVAVYYVHNPTVTGSQTFTISAANASIVAMGFSGSCAACSVLDQSNANASGSTGTSITTGSITPTQGGEMIVSGNSMSAAGTVSINSSMTIPANGQTSFQGGKNYGSAGAYFAQTSAAAINPTWTVPSMPNLVANIFSFIGVAASTGARGLTTTGSGHFFPANDDLEPANDNHGGKVLHWAKP